MAHQLGEDMDEGLDYQLDSESDDEQLVEDPVRSRAGGESRRWPEMMGGVHLLPAHPAPRSALRLVGPCQPACGLQSCRLGCDQSLFPSALHVPPAAGPAPRRGGGARPHPAPPLFAPHRAAPPGGARPGGQQ